MTRGWWFARLFRPLWTDNFDRDAEVLLTLLPDVVARLRAADGAAHWSFQRLAGPAGGGLGVWLHATAAALEDAGRWMAAGARGLGWSTAPDAGGRALTRDLPPHPELSTAASDFALAVLRRGQPTVDTALPMAVRHLRRVAGLVAPDERRPFLFECWRHWSDGLAPGVRVKLTILADAWPGPVGAGCPQVDWAAYDRMLDGLGRVTGPMKYPLFRLADATHNRLGIPPADQALAALIARRRP